MLVPLLGAPSSPCCAHKSLRKAADNNKHTYNSEVMKAVHRNFYVDDGLKLVSTREQAIRLADQLLQLLKEGGFRLTKCMSNRHKVLASIPVEEHTNARMDLDLYQLRIERVLGLHWNAETDIFQFKVVSTNKPTTKRGILSVVSSLYDPLGFESIRLAS